MKARVLAALVFLIALDASADGLYEVIFARPGGEVVRDVVIASSNANAARRAIGDRNVSAGLVCVRLVLSSNAVPAQGQTAQSTDGDTWNCVRFDN